jgi:DNA-binding XRE family transcriptional regulator
VKYIKKWIAGLFTTAQFSVIVWGILRRENTMKIQPDAGMKQFGNYLKELRTNKGLSQALAAIRTQRTQMTVTQATVGKYEKGQVMDPDPQVIKALAQIYGASYEELLWKLLLAKYGLDEQFLEFLRSTICSRS